MAPSFEAIGQLTQRPTARLNSTQNWPRIKTECSDWRWNLTELLREALSPTLPKPKSGPIDEGKDGPLLRGDRSFSTQLFGAISQY